MYRFKRLKNISRYPIIIQKKKKKGKRKKKRIFRYFAKAIRFFLRKRQKKKKKEKYESIQKRMHCLSRRSNRVFKNVKVN